jgi:hypothetical protein
MFLYTACCRNNFLDKLLVKERFSVTWRRFLWQQLKMDLAGFSESLLSSTETHYVTAIET